MFEKMFIALRATNLKQLKCPFLQYRLDKLWYIFIQGNIIWQWKLTVTFTPSNVDESQRHNCE